MIEISRMQIDEIPNIPESGIPEGILPREIRKLVELRREVKKLMKLPGLSSTKREQVSHFSFLSRIFA
jgi:DNA polymerase alpha subunit A